MNIDDTIKNVLGKNKNTKTKGNMFSFKTNTSTFNKPMFSKPTFNNPIKNVMNTIRTTSVIPKISSMPGASLKMQNQWKAFSPTQKNILRSRLPDSDGDRIPDKYDCQPKNVMRQDGEIVEKEPIYKGNYPRNIRLYAFYNSNTDRRITTPFFINAIQTAPHIIISRDDKYKCQFGTPSTISEIDEDYVVFNNKKKDLDLWNCEEKYLGNEDNNKDFNNFNSISKIDFVIYEDLIK